MTFLDPPRRSKAPLIIAAAVILLVSRPAQGQNTASALTKEQALAYLDRVDRMDMIGILMRDGIELNSRSYFPQNTGGDNYDETDWCVATNRVHVGGDHPSHVILNIIPQK